MRVHPDGDVVIIYGNVTISFGRLLFDSLFQIYSKLLVVKIAALQLRLHCVLRDPVWCRRQQWHRQHQCHVFLRAFNSIDYSKYIQKYWWLRSPPTDWVEGACLVYSSGDVYYGKHNVRNSYGRTISPDSFMYYNYTSFYVIEDGSMITYAVEYFYGINKI